MTVISTATYVSAQTTDVNISFCVYNSLIHDGFIRIYRGRYLQLSAYMNWACCIISEPKPLQDHCCPYVY